MAEDYAWTCPYCRQVATITKENISSDLHAFYNKNKTGSNLAIWTFVTVCPNSACREYTIEAALYRANWKDGWKTTGDPLLKWNLKPQSAAKPFPEYIPEPLRRDYEEACLIASLSPKASATLPRRCLQGIIRDFWGISKPRLIDEIAELSGKVDSTTWAAIDAVRGIGNIGAHMEKDINLIIDVEPEEANLLIHLIEVLFEEWYVHRYERGAHMQKVIAAAQAKSDAKSSGKP